MLAAHEIWESMGHTSPVRVMSASPERPSGVVEWYIDGKLCRMHAYDVWRFGGTDKLRLDAKGFLVWTGCNPRRRAHQLLADARPGESVLFADGDRLNCARENLVK